MTGPTPLPPQSFLNIVGICDNFRVHSLPSQQSTFRTENDLVLWRLDSKPTSPAIGLLRSPIVQRLAAENASVPKPESAWSFTSDGGREVVSFADWVDTPSKRTHVMAELCKRWRDEGLWADVIGPKKWRGEMYPVYRNPFGKNDALREEDLSTLGNADDGNFAFMMERAACALFGTVTYGVHMTAYVEDADGCKIWVPTRARTKQTWPGYLDNSVAGGISSGSGVFETVVKEAMEEASIPEEVIKKYAKAVGSVSYFYRRVWRRSTCHL